MQHECRITVLETKVFQELQENIWLIQSQDCVPASRQAIYFC